MPVATIARQCHEYVPDKVMLRARLCDDRGLWCVVRPAALNRRRRAAVVCRLGRRSLGLFDVGCHRRQPPERKMPTQKTLISLRQAGDAFMLSANQMKSFVGRRVAVSVLTMSGPVERASLSAHRRQGI